MVRLETAEKLSIPCIATCLGNQWKQTACALKISLVHHSTVRLNLRLLRFAIFCMAATAQPLFANQALSSFEANPVKYTQSIQPIPAWAATEQYLYDNEIRLSSKDNAFGSKPVFNSHDSYLLPNNVSEIKSKQQLEQLRSDYLAIRSALEPYNYLGTKPLFITGAEFSPPEMNKPAKQGTSALRYIAKKTIKRWWTNRKASRKSSKSRILNHASQMVADNNTHKLDYSVRLSNSKINFVLKKQL